MKAADNFTEVPFTGANLDRYYIRTSIFKAIQDSKQFFKNNLIDVGCGKMPYRDHILNNTPVNTYTGLDIENGLVYEKGIKPDFTWDGITMPFEDAQFDTALGTEVLEHCPRPDIILGEVCRVLRPGGIFFFTVPFLWPLHEVPHDEYRYTPFSLKRSLEENGFENIDIKATGGWHASMAQMLGLWVRRSPLSNKRRSLLAVILKPIIKKLITMDKLTPISFKEGQMITGLYGTAHKK